ncbi:MAG TPA: SusC/RagA family TonB-linked outer membrane protein [Puia sp.]|nr:SusC/RagA family TonB-linked outer membrane protein [Puia sp.]
MRKNFLLTILLFVCTYSFAQRVVSGRITDSRDGSPLAGATVSAKNSDVKTQTANDGTFRIRLTEAQKILVISHVGFPNTEISISGKQQINISLKSLETQLQEVVVVAYGTTSKKELTGSVVKVDAKQLENIPFTSVDQMLQGKVAGLQSIASSGQPGTAQDIVIRGIGSISANASPLFVVDGIPVNTGDFSSLSQTSNALAGLNPNDIESVSVLKDAASESIYGSRGANGVILITTKKGKPGKTQFSIDLESGTNSRAYSPFAGKPLTHDQFFTLTDEGVINAGGTQADVDQVDAALGKNNGVNTDWLKEVQRRGLQQSFNVAASGGDQKTNFYLSGGYFDQQASILASEFKRYSGSFTIQHHVNEKLTFNATLNISQSLQHTPLVGGAFRNPIQEALVLLPSQPAIDHDTIVYDRNDFDLLNGLYNPLAIAKFDRNTLSNLKGIGTAGAEYAFLPYLSFSSKYGIDYLTLEEVQYWNPFFGDAFSRGGDLGSNYTRVFNWVWTNTLDFHQSFGRKAEFKTSLKAGYESQRSQSYVLMAYGSGVPMTTALVLPAVSTPTTASESQSNYSFVSEFALGSISYRDKYVVSGSVRRDGSSRFGVDNRYGTFWSVGASWNIDQESFLVGSTVINALKLRSSYGVNGNAGIGNYQAIATYGFGNGNNYVQQPGSYPDNVGNPNLTWELNKPFNIGLDAGILKNRINFTVEYYTRTTDHLLLSVPLSQTSGFSSAEENVGAMKNSGVEITFNATPVRSAFRWDIGFNLALNRNRVTELYQGQDIANLPYLVRVGQDVQSIYTRLWAGADPETGAPTWYTDGTKTSKTSDITQVKRAIVGSADPRGLGGFTNTFSYKGFALDAQFSFQYGNKLYDGYGVYINHDGSSPADNSNQKEMRRWQKPGDKTDIPAYVYFNSSNSTFGSTRYVYDGSFIRLRNVTFSYEMPKPWLKRVGFASLMIYARGSNFWTKTFDKNLVFDPENGTPGPSATPTQGLNNLQIFIQKSFSLGLNLGF